MANHILGAATSVPRGRQVVDYPCPRPTVIGGPFANAVAAIKTTSQQDRRCPVFCDNLTAAVAATHFRGKQGCSKVHDVQVLSPISVSANGVNNSIPSPPTTSRRIHSDLGQPHRQRRKAETRSDNTAPTTGRVLAPKTADWGEYPLVAHLELRESRDRRTNVRGDTVCN